MSTFTRYEHLKAYWFNPKFKKVELRIRDTRPYSDPAITRAILAKLEIARSKL